MSDDTQRREEIKAALAGGLQTTVEPRADTHEMVLKIIDELHKSNGELETKLVISGFTLKPVEHGGVEQLCESCMYYERHRRYCELPEHGFPVDPEWSCRLWRI